MAGEAELMARYCDGDVGAFEALYAAVAPRLLAYLVGLVADRAAAEDLLQLTFLKLHEARSIYVRGADPVPWLYTIAHRTCLDELRRRKRSRVRVGEEVPASAEPRADLSGAAEGAGARDRGFSDETLRALETLPASQREALLLTTIQGRSLKEAAAITGATPSAIKLRAHRGYVALRKLLKKEGA
jgi:RNA polymerase sigma-70 factor (ECF subfamily)